MAWLQKMTNSQEHKNVPMSGKVGGTIDETNSTVVMLITNL